MDETRAADIDSSREEGHTQGLLVSYTLEGTDQVCALEVLVRLVLVRMTKRWTNLGFVRPLIPQLIHRVELAEWTQDSTHKT